MVSPLVVMSDSCLVYCSSTCILHMLHAVSKHRAPVSGVSRPNLLIHGTVTEKSSYAMIAVTPL